MRYDHTPVTTTDATPTRIAVVEIPEYFGGLFDIWIIAKEDTGALGGLRCRQIIGFDKTTTLALDTPVDVYSLVDDMGVGGFVIQVDTNENLEIIATGILATVINWAVSTDDFQINATTLP